MKSNHFSLVIAIILLLPIGLHAQEFVNPIQIPPLISSDVTNYHLNVIETEHNFNPFGTDSLNTMVRTFAFENADDPGTTTILGPTISWQFGDLLSPQVTNNLSERTTTHWHGAHVPQSADGGPHQIIQAGATWTPPPFEVKDKSATMWYHPHAMGLTYEHVQMGLSGILLVEDPDGEDPTLEAIHDILPHDYAVNDFPLIFQTKKFKRNSMTNEVEIQSVQGYKNKYTYLVNGIQDPVLEVPAAMVRFRVLNGDGKFSFNLGLTEDGPNSVDPLGFQLIATDAGYTDRSYSFDEILMAPGERTEWLIDLRGYPSGTEFYIYNKVSDIPDGIIGNSSTTSNYAVDRALLKIVVTDDMAPLSPIISFPIALHPLETPSMDEVTNTRVKTFRQDTFIMDGDTSNLFNIDSTLMNMMVVNDVVKLDSTEIWTIDNQTGIGHPWHIHDIHFWVTEVIDSSGNSLNPDDYPQIFKGPKDNVLVMPYWKLSYITTFSDYGTEIAFDSSYMYHCHILPHEDRGMMGQFVVWNGLGDPPVSTEDPTLSTRSMKVYPNPAQGFLLLEGSSIAESTVRMIDLNGRVLKIMTLPAFEGAIRLEVNDLPGGLHILEWQSQEGRGIGKVFLE